MIAALLSGAAAARELASHALEASDGRAHILVNDAAARSFGPTQATAEDDFDSTFAVNVKVPCFLAGALAPTMAERGQAAVLNITSIAAGIGVTGQALYGASKAALVLLTKAWAAVQGPSGVRVNAV